MCNVFRSEFHVLGSLVTLSIILVCTVVVCLVDVECHLFCVLFSSHGRTATFQSHIVATANEEEREYQINEAAYVSVFWLLVATPTVLGGATPWRPGPPFGFGGGQGPGAGRRQMSVVASRSRCHCQQHKACCCRGRRSSSTTHRSITHSTKSVASLPLRSLRFLSLRSGVSP